MLRFLMYIMYNKHFHLNTKYIILNEFCNEFCKEFIKSSLTFQGLELASILINKDNNKCRRHKECSELMGPLFNAS